MSEADTVVASVVLGLALIVGLMSWYGIRLARRTESASAALNPAAVRAQIREQLGQVRFVWGVWQGRLSVSGWQLRVYDELGQLITEIDSPTLREDGVLQRFTLEGRDYECVPGGGRSRLREVPSGAVVFSCQHGALRRVFHVDVSDEPLFELGFGSVFEEHAPVVGGAIVEGRLQTLHLGDASAVVFSARSHALSRLEICFLFASLRG